MADSRDQVRQSDVAFWGIVALVVGAIAVLGANLSAILPPNMITGLHSTRLEGGNLNHLRSQVAELKDETARMRNENSRLMTMLTLAEQDQGDVARRIGAIENSLPVLLEAVPPGVSVDRSAITSAVNTAEAEVLPAEGGSMSVMRMPLEGTSPDADVSSGTDRQTVVQPLPIVPQTEEPRVILQQPSATAYGIALGPQVTVRDAFLAWKDITTKVGPLLLGLGPLLSGNAGSDHQRLVAGPIEDFAQAEQLCVRMIRVGISCLAVPYAGRALPE